MRKMYVIHVKYKYNDYLVSEKHLSNFERHFGEIDDNTIKIIKEVNCCKIKKVDKFFEARWSNGVNAILIVTENNEIYICKEDGHIWDVIKGNEEQLREKLKEISAIHGYDSRKLEEFIVSRHSLKLSRLGANRLNELITFFSDYENNIKEEERQRELYALMSGID